MSDKVKELVLTEEPGQPAKLEMTLASGRVVATPLNGIVEIPKKKEPAKPKPKDVDA